MRASFALTLFALTAIPAAHAAESPIDLVADEMKAYEKLVLTAKSLDDEQTKQAAKHVTAALVIAAQVDALYPRNHSRTRRVADTALGTVGAAASVALGSVAGFGGLAAIALQTLDLGSPGIRTGLMVSTLISTILVERIGTYTWRLLKEGALNIPQSDKLTPFVLRKLTRIGQKLDKKKAPDDIQKLNADLKNFTARYSRDVARFSQISSAERCAYILSHH